MLSESKYINNNLKTNHQTPTHITIFIFFSEKNNIKKDIQSNHTHTHTHQVSKYNIDKKERERESLHSVRVIEIAVKFSYQPRFTFRQKIK